MIGRLLAALLFCHGAQAAGVVSLNLCTDQYLVQLAPEQVAALSPLARDPSLSVVAAEAARLPWVRADAEAVLKLAAQGRVEGQSVEVLIQNRFGEMRPLE